MSIMMAAPDVAQARTTSFTSPSPTISVIVPAHNCAETIGATLDSLAAQTFQEYEVIVVDDGSMDGTAHVANQHARRDPRIRVITRATASGRPACARNIGIAAATGKYLALLDGDDTSAPDRLGSALNAIRLSGAPVAFADFCRHFDSEGVREEPSVLAQRNFLELAREHLTAIDRNVYGCGTNFVKFMILHFEAMSTLTLVFDRDLLEPGENAFNETLVCGEDLDLYYRLALKARFVFVNEVQGEYHIRSSSLTRRFPAQTVLDGAEVRLKYFHLLRNRLSKVDATQTRAKIARALAEVAYDRWCNGDLPGARELFVRSWRISASTGAAKGFFKAWVRRAWALAVIDRLRGRTSSA